ncbi:MAG: type II toxin-antitoxin system ParD family antitoxin [Pirellulales bacterium]|nr:type II toxin-antitoxin system ParD family antitoxin [Pirellulales bacterium]
MHLELPSDARQFIDGLVGSGKYGSADDAIVEGVRLLMSREQLKADIDEGVRELDAGLGIAGPDVVAELRQVVDCHSLQTNE